MGFAQENTLSSMWDLLEPGEASVRARDGTIVDTSSRKDFKASASATMMPADGPRLAEVSGAVPWPSEWAALTSSSHDFRKVSGYGFYAEAGTLDLKSSLSPNDPRIQTIVPISKGFACNQDVHLKPGAQTYQYSCDDSFVVGVVSPSGQEESPAGPGETADGICGMPAF